MTVLRATELVAAPPRTVLAALTERAVLTVALRPLRIEVPGGGQFAVGDALPRGLTVTRVDAGGVEASGPRVTWTVALAPTAAGTLVTTGLAWTTGGPLGRVADVLGRRRVLRLLTGLVTAVRQRAEALAAARVVVGAVLVRDGRVLAAQRGYPPSAAGRWEFPGGKVGDGETEPAALARECREELGIDAVIGERVGPDVVLTDDLVLRCYAATTPDDPAGLEHRSLRWLPAAELATVDWLPADRVLLPPVRALLAA